MVGLLAGWLAWRCGMAYQDISESRMYCRAEEVADETWSVVIK